MDKIMKFQHHHKQNRIHMKKLIFPILFLLLSTAGYAQRFAGDYGFRLGLTAHPNFGFIKAEGGKGNGVSLGFSYGLIGDFNFAENYSFSTGITITTINGKSTELVDLLTSSSMPQPKVEQKNKYMMQYIELPLTIKLKTQAIDGRRWYGQFGLSNDFRISARMDSETTAMNVKTTDVNATDYTNFYRAGLIIGGGGEFDLSGKTSLLLGLTYNNGFTNISSLDNNIKNHYVGINFGVFF